MCAQYDRFVCITSLDVEAAEKEEEDDDNELLLKIIELDKTIGSLEPEETKCLSTKGNY